MNNNLPADAWIQTWWQHLLELGTRKPELWPQTVDRLLTGIELMKNWTDREKQDGYLYLILAEVGWYLQGSDEIIPTEDEIYGKAKRLLGGAPHLLKPPTVQTMQMLRSLKEHYAVEPVRK